MFLNMEIDKEIKILNINKIYCWKIVGKIKEKFSK
jgi:hypothetical protein